jgi:hypothetical protein
MSTTSRSFEPRAEAEFGLAIQSGYFALLCRLLLCWGFAVAVAFLAIFALRAPDPLPANTPPANFSAERALAHVRVIGAAPHPIGSPENDGVRNYLVAQLALLGLQPQVLPDLGVRTGYSDINVGATQNILGYLPGAANSKAIMLVAHYDSVPRSPGAADDGAGVAAILETARALRTGPALKNDVFFLFTDGEEPGMLGADAAASLPWMKKLGLIMNFEARGDKGPSLLFETGTNNAALINVVAQRASYPIGSSLFYSLYRLLPNNTDFTVFRRQNIPGLNFAFGENWEAYHTRLDTPSNLSLSSLQHHGSYALDLTRSFGAMDLSKLPGQNGDDVFFDWFGAHLVAYKQSWVIPGQILLTIALFAAIVLDIRRGKARLSKIFGAALVSFVFLIVVPAAMAAVELIIARVLGGSMLVADSRANALLLAGLVLFGVCVAILLFTFTRRRSSSHEFAFGGLVVVCGLSWFLALALPAGNYLLFWPLLLMTAGLTATAISKSERPLIIHVTGFAGMAGTILLFAPLSYLLYIFLTLKLMSVLAIGLLLAVAFLLCGPFFEIAAPQQSWRPVVLLELASALACLIAGVASSGHTPLHPQRDTMVYSMNADMHKAAWISYDDSLDAWTAKVIPNKTEARIAAPEYLAGSDQPVFITPANVIEMPAPTAEKESDQHDGEFRHVRIRIASARKAAVTSLIFDEQSHPESISIGGRMIPLGRSPDAKRLRLWGWQDKNVELELTFRDPQKLSFWLVDQTFGLPTMLNPRPAGLMAGEGSDVTVIVRKYDW